VCFVHAGCGVNALSGLQILAIKMIATTINNKKAPEIAAVILPALLIVRFLIFFLCQS
jgi:hypothetical protein